MAPAIISLNSQPAEEALFDGAPVAHVVARLERMRLARIADVGRAMVRRRGFAS